MQPASPLHDGHGRSVDYLRLSVTARCNLRCRYCLPDGSAPESPDLLGFADLTRLAARFAALGVSRIRLTGGEPLVRRGLPDLVARLAALPGIHEISLTTNGVLLARQAKALREAGLGRVNVSLDALDAGLASRIAGADVLGRVLEGLDAADAAGLRPVKVNTVVMRGVNEDQVLPIAELCAARGYVLRLIEPMPMGDTFTAPADMAAVLASLRARFDLRDAAVADGAGPARYLASADGGLRIGLITPLSQHFCATCNRVRLTAEGKLHTCLGDEGATDLSALLRAGADDGALHAAIVAALAAKPAGHDFVEAPLRHRRTMAVTGG